MRTISSIVIVLTAGLSACSTSVAPQAKQEVKAADQAFVSAGAINMELSGGGYTIRPADGDRVRVTFSGDVGSATAALTIDGMNAKLVVKDTPKNNFHAAIEVPKAANLLVNLSGGDLELGMITGDKDIEVGGGNVQISAGDPSDYASVDASVKAGDLNAGPFGETKSGLLQSVNWSGHGKYKLHVTLGAGNLQLQAK